MTEVPVAFEFLQFPPDERNSDPPKDPGNTDHLRNVYFMKVGHDFQQDLFREMANPRSKVRRRRSNRVRS